jgi:hypothetical protein
MRAAAGLRSKPNPILYPGVDPDRVLRSSLAASVVLPDRAILNNPTEDWYVPITPIHATPAQLADAYVSASLWEPPTWSWSAAEIEIRLVFQDDDKRAFEAIGVREVPNQERTLYRYTFDDQRAETGYEGEERTTMPVDLPALRDFLEVIRAITESTS